jgi:hypothetical protein
MAVVDVALDGGGRSESAVPGWVTWSPPCRSDSDDDAGPPLTPARCRVDLGRLSAALAVEVVPVVGTKAIGV